MEEWQRAELEETPSELHNLGLKGIEASDEMLTTFLHAEESSMLSKIYELDKVSLKDRNQTDSNRKRASDETIRLPSARDYLNLMRYA